MSMDQRLTEAGAQAPDIGERLKQAVQAGDIDALYALIREDACVLEGIDEVPFVDTPLHIAASSGHIHFAMEMVNLNASFTRKLNPDGFSPMHLASQNENMLMVMWLIDFDGNLVRVKGKGGVTPLHYAAEKGNSSILKECFKGCPESIKNVTFQGDTALHFAIKNHDAFELLLMEWLRQSEFEDAEFWEREILNWKNQEGKTVLYIAASENGWNDQQQTFGPSESSEINIKVKIFAVASLSPPGGLWQGNYNKDFKWHDHVSATGPTSPPPAPPPHYSGTSVTSTGALLAFYILYAGLLLLTAWRTMANLINDDSELSFTVFLLVG
ncbi:hypothetical protein GH714_030275 [Hevea brasiliensis]|uniref:Uncharacterized protein n=1 Tax=Hevea brasiliensis TaxID=3981 RepID=A0A6A6LN79_HEVBR|nr:hypothetical protein GH714_030275 [Hevea brasiliensis]